MSWSLSGRPRSWTCYQCRQPQVGSNVPAIGHGLLPGNGIVLPGFRKRLTLTARARLAARAVGANAGRRGLAFGDSRIRSVQLAKSKRKTRDSSASEGAPRKMARKEFEKELYKLQVELTRLQAWAVAEGAG